MATIGFKQAHIGILNDEDKVTKVFVLDSKEGGTIDANISGLAPSKNTVFASNGPFYVSALGTSSPTMELGVADLPEEVLEAISGTVIDEKGIARLGNDTTPPYVAVVLETQGRKGDKIYLGMYKGKFGYTDSLELKTNEDNGAELNTDSITGEFVANAAGNVLAKTRSSNTGFDLDGFMKEVMPGSELLG